MVWMSLLKRGRFSAHITQSYLRSLSGCDLLDSILESICRALVCDKLNGDVRGIILCVFFGAEDDDDLAVWRNWLSIDGIYFA